MAHVLVSLFLLAFIMFAIADGAPSGLLPRLFPRFFQFIGQTLGLSNRWRHFHSVYSKVQHRLQVVLYFIDGSTRPQPLRPRVLRSRILDDLASHKMGKVEVALLWRPHKMLLAGVAEHVVAALPPEDVARLAAIEFRRLIAVVPAMDAADQTVDIQEEPLFTFTVARAASRGVA
jgi:hypothetical protein